MTEKSGLHLRTRRRSGLAWADIGVLTAVLPFAIAGLRVLFYSEGDAVLLRVLVSTLDVTTVIFGTLLPAIPVLLTSAAILLLSDLGMLREIFRARPTGRRRVLALLVLMCLASWVLLAPWDRVLSTIQALSAGVIPAMVVIYAITVWVRRRKSGSWKRIWRVNLIGAPIGRPGRVVALISVCLVLFFTVPFGMWLPQERIRVDGNTLSGYMLKDADGWATILLSDKSIIRQRSDSIDMRSVCGQGEHRSLISMISPSETPMSETCEAPN